MPLVNKQPFKPIPIPGNLSPDDEVFYHELTNEIFTSHDAFLDRFLYCNSLIWTCSRTGKSCLTYKEALESEQAQTTAKRRKKYKKATQDETKQTSSDATSTNADSSTKTTTTITDATITNGDGTEQLVKKKKKKYPYDPKKYSMPVPEGFDPSLLTPTGKIDGRKLKSKKNKSLAEELLAASFYEPKTSPGKRGKKRKDKDDEAKKKEDDSKKKEEEAKKKAQMQAELARERELEAKRKKEAAALARQLERQRKDEERKKAAAFLQNWEKKCEDLERDDLRRLPQPTPVDCEIPEKLFGDSIFIMEAIYNFHDLYNFAEIYPDGLTWDTLEEILLDKQEEGALGKVIQYLLRVIFDTQPTKNGYGLDDDTTKLLQQQEANDDGALIKQESKAAEVKPETNDQNGDYEVNSMGSEADDDENDENVDKDVNMNDLIGSAIKAAREVKMTFSKPLPEMEITPYNVTEILRYHLLQSGSFPKGRTIYNGWYSSREDPGLWLCMQEPDLIKKLGEVTIYDLDIDERIKILHTLIYQLLTFIKTRTFMDVASDQLTELRKSYRSTAAEFARWDRENCVKRMQPPALKSCLKANGTSQPDGGQVNESEDAQVSKRKITFKTGQNGAMDENGGGHEDQVGQIGIENQTSNDIEMKTSDETEQSYEELERAYQQNTVDYEDYQRERAIRLEQLNETLLDIRTQLRSNQSVYAIHPIGRDRAYRRYWLFQSLPGLFVEQDDEYVGRCLPNPTPLESRYKKLFGKENPLMHPNEADLIRTKTCDVACSTDTSELITTGNQAQANAEPRGEGEQRQQLDKGEKKEAEHHENNKIESKEDSKNQISDRHNGDHAHEGGDQEAEEQSERPNDSVITDEMNYCTGDETTCYIHGQKRPTQTKWWFYWQPESIDRLIENLNKRGFRESELHDVLSAESSIIKPRVAECPAYKLNRLIREQSGIRRSRRLRTKSGKRRKHHHHH